MTKLKLNCVYTPKERIKNACLQDDIYVLLTFLWWVKTKDAMLGITRWNTKKRILDEYEYGWYVPTHQEMG